MSAFLRLPVSAPSTYGTIPGNDIDSFTNAEMDAWEHWIFDKANSSALVGKISGRTLAVQSTGPTYSSLYLTTPTAIDQGLVTNKADTASAVETWCVVFRPKANIVNTTANDANIFVGNLDAAANSRGGSLFLRGAIGYPKNIYFNFFSAGGTSMTGSQNTNFAVSADNWYFVAFTRDFSGATKSFSVLLGGQPTPFTYTTTNAYNPGLPIGIGNNYWQVAQAMPGNYDFAEFIVFNSAKSSSELQDLYARRKQKLANRGISVV